MRQPSYVLDALADPSTKGKLFPLNEMRMLDSLDRGAYACSEICKQIFGFSNLEMQSLLRGFLPMCMRFNGTKLSKHHIFYRDLMF